MKTLQLSVADRLLLVPVLPNMGGRIEMMLVQSLIKDVGFTPNEIQEFELRDTNSGGVAGNALKFKDKSIDVSDELVKVLKAIPERLDAEKRVTTEILPLLDKIDAL